MNGTSHSIRRTLQALALTASIAAVAAPEAAAAGYGSPGMVPSKLGSPDPREANSNVSSAGFVPSRLGSQDPRDTAAASSVSRASIVARQLGSQDPRDTASQSLAQSSIVARQLGSQDPRDTAAESVSQSSIVARQLGSPDTRDAVMQALDGGFFVRSTHDTAVPKDGRDWSNFGIGIVVAACGLLLLSALGIGARQVRHTRHRLGSA